MQREITFRRAKRPPQHFVNGGTGSLTTVKKKRRSVTSCKRTNSVAVKSILVNNERDLENKITYLHKIETLASRA